MLAAEDAVMIELGEASGDVFADATLTEVMRVVRRMAEAQFCWGCPNERALRGGFSVM